jgi:hypothetical protein
MKKSLIPQKLFLFKVFFSIDINSIPDVDPTKLKFQSDYKIKLRWYDPRYEKIQNH